MNDRKSIRYKVKSMLDNNIIFKGNPIAIHPNRITPFFGVELPAIGIYTFDEPADPQNTQPQVYRRSLNLGIQVLLDGETGRVIDDDLDDISALIEKFMFFNPTLDPLENVESCDLVNTSQDLKDQGDKLYGSSILQFQVEYIRDAINRDDLTLDDFNTEKSGFDINEDGETEIESQSTMPS